MSQYRLVHTCNCTGVYIAVHTSTDLYMLVKACAEMHIAVPTCTHLYRLVHWRALACTGVCTLAQTVQSVSVQSVQTCTTLYTAVQLYTSLYTIV